MRSQDALERTPASSLSPSMETDRLVKYSAAKNSAKRLRKAKQTLWDFRPSACRQRAPSNDRRKGPGWRPIHGAPSTFGCSRGPRSLGDSQRLKSKTSTADMRRPTGKLDSQRLGLPSRALPNRRSFLRTRCVHSAMPSRHRALLEQFGLIGRGCREQRQTQAVMLASRARPE